MASLRTILSRIRGSFGRQRADQQFDEEFQSHLEMLAERFARLGMTREEAFYAARRQFGDLTQTRESMRRRRGLPLDAFARDVRYAFRQLWKAPVFAAAAVLTLALGIGANTAVFAVVNAVLLRPLPYPHADRLVAVEACDHRGGPHPDNLSYPNFFDYRSNSNSVFEHLVSYRDNQFVLSGDEQATHLDGEIVSSDLFELLGVKPELGRGFLAEEEKAGTRVVVLSHELWQSHFGGDRGIIGRSVTMDGNSFTVIGVAPPGFHFPADSPTTQIWTTLAVDAVVSKPHTPMTAQRGAGMLQALARLKPGVSLDAAHAQMDQIALALARQYPENNQNLTSTYVRPELEHMASDTRQPMMILMAAVGLVLLIACANVANLLLARSTERQREFAVRAAIGASRANIVRQLLTESAALAMLGGLAGVLLALGTIRVLVPLAGESIPRIAETSVDFHVLGFSFALALATIVLFSLAPAIRGARVDLIQSLKESARSLSPGRDRLRNVLVVGQITLGMVLITSASLLAANFLRLQCRDLGFRPDNLLTFSTSLPWAHYDVSHQITFSDRALSELRNLPGVQSAAAGFPLPLAGDQIVISFNISERPTPPGQHPTADLAIVTPGYFSTLGIPLLKGRDFSERDDAQAPPVLVVNQAFADRFFPGENVIGKWIEPGASNGREETRPHEIVGLVGNAKQTALAPGDDPIYYFPYKQLSWTIGRLVARTSVPPRSIESAVRAKITSLEKQAAVYGAHEMEESVAAAIARPRFQMVVLSSFAVIALLLTAVGLYGLLMYSVMKRTREIGVRIALGASRAMVLSNILRQALRLIAIGLVLGLVGAIAGRHLLQSMLYGLKAEGSLVLPALVVILTGMIAAYLPARRAANIDPMQAIREE